MSNNKMKGLLKGLRYISQIFDNEKEPEMQIGYPTDVKHVAHIGWDGPSVASSPSWMNEFKGAPGGLPSGPSDGNGEENSIRSSASEGSSRGSSKSRGLDPELPRGSRSTERAGNGNGNGNGGSDSPIKEKPEKSKQSRKLSRNAAKESGESKSSTRHNKNQTSDSSASNPPEISKKSRRKKSKDGSNSKTTRVKAQASSSDIAECSSESGSLSRSVNGDLCQPAFEEDAENGFS